MSKEIRSLDQEATPEREPEEMAILGRRLLAACKRLSSHRDEDVDQAIGLALGLIGQGAPTTATDHKGRNCLFLALEAGNMAMIEELLLAGTDLSATDHFGNSAFSRAAFLASEKALRLLAPASDVNHVNDNGDTPLALAMNNVMAMNSDAPDPWGALKFLLEVSDLSILIEADADQAVPKMSVLAYARDILDEEPLALVERAVGAAEAKKQAEEIALVVGASLAEGSPRKGLAL